MNKLTQGEQRVERDYVGEVTIPGDKLYGVNTVRGVDNLTVSSLNIAHYAQFRDAFAQVKWAAALANCKGEIESYLKIAPARVRDIDIIIHFEINAVPAPEIAPREGAAPLGKGREVGELAEPDACGEVGEVVLAAGDLDVHAVFARADHALQAELLAAYAAGPTMAV